MWGGGNNNNNNDNINNNNNHHGYNHHAATSYGYPPYGNTGYDNTAARVSASTPPQETQFYPQFSNAGVSHGGSTQNDILQQMMVAAAVQQQQQQSQLQQRQSLEEYMHMQRVHRGFMTQQQEEYTNTKDSSQAVADNTMYSNSSSHENIRYQQQSHQQDDEQDDDHEEAVETYGIPQQEAHQQTHPQQQPHQSHHTMNHSNNIHYNQEEDYEDKDEDDAVIVQDPVIPSKNRMELYNYSNHSINMNMNNNTTTSSNNAFELSPLVSSKAGNTMVASKEFQQQQLDNDEDNQDKMEDEGSVQTDIYGDSNQDASHLRENQKLQETPSSHQKTSTLSTIATDNTMVSSQTEQPPQTITKQPQTSDEDDEDDVSDDSDNDKMNTVESTKSPSEPIKSRHTPAETSTPSNKKKSSTSTSINSNKKKKLPTNPKLHQQQSQNNQNKKTSLLSSPGGNKVLDSLLTYRNKGDDDKSANGEEKETMTEAEYLNLEALMHQFCRVPLLAEFSRPISLLHPELLAVYSKVVKHPCDLGKVCRAIRRKQYNSTREVCVDVWRIFANCVKYHTHSITKEYGAAIPSFISIALHLRDYFNSLWQEYMIPSELTESEIKQGIPYNTNLHEKREAQRRNRINSTCTTILSTKCINKTANAISSFLNLSGRVDQLDAESLLKKLDEDENDAVQAVFSELGQLMYQLRQVSNSNQEYTVDMLDRSIKRCYNNDVFEGFPLLRQKIAYRLDRLLNKILVPIHETNCRGVNQSSIWGCMAAAIWARESTKRPYWPALVLGILAPDDQKEDWHKALTDRNEARLPERIRHELQSGKKKAEQALKKQAEGHAERMSFFLVEFLGSHEFIWVREADILESFDPNVDPNITDLATGAVSKRKKNHPLHGTHSSNNRAKLFNRALEEGRWSLEEFELQLTDPCGDLAEATESNANKEEEEIDNYSFNVLCESDDEADEADGATEDISNSTDLNKMVIRTPTGELSDIEEVNELLATDGLLDYSADGRRNAKRRAQQLKRLQADAKKAALKKKQKESKKAKTKKKKSPTKDQGLTTSQSSSKIKKKQSNSPKRKQDTDTPPSSLNSKTDKRAKKSPNSKSLPFTSTSNKKKALSSSKSPSTAAVQAARKLEREKQWETKREQKELEKRRKKRERERERNLREQERKDKRRKKLSDHGLNRSGRKLGINDKKGRANSIVKGYLNRMILKDPNLLQNIAINGVTSMSTAGVEASGLLGMALAFRASSGEISMPNDLDNASVFRPWERIDGSLDINQETRCRALKQKIQLLQKALVKLDKDDERRLKLIEETEAIKEIEIQKILSNEKEARKNVLPRKKRNILSKSKKQDTAPDDDEGNDNIANIGKKENDDTELRTISRIKQENSVTGDNKLKFNNLDNNTDAFVKVESNPEAIEDEDAKTTNETDDEDFDDNENIKNENMVPSSLSNDLKENDVEGQIIAPKENEYDYSHDYNHVTQRKSSIDSDDDDDNDNVDYTKEENIVEAADHSDEDIDNESQSEDMIQ